MPQSCETRRMPRTKKSKLLDAQRIFDQLLAVGDFLVELGIRALARHLDPRVVLGRGESDDLYLVVLEHLHHLVVEPFGVRGEELLRLRAGLQQRSEERRVGKECRSRWS